MDATIGGLLAANGLPALEAEVLAAHALGVARVHVLAHPERAVEMEPLRRAENLFARRRAGEPIAYLTGEREFFGLSLKITPDVLIPRPETELLVERALERIHSTRGKRVLDMGTGSGAIAIAIAHAAPDAEVVGVDASEAVLELAYENARRHGVTIRFVCSDWFADVADDCFNVIVSNPPYIAAGDPHLAQGDLRFEPRRALLAGADGLDAIRVISAHASAHLAPGGWLLFEHGHDQAEHCRQLLAARGFTDISTAPDLAGIERVSGGRWCQPDRRSP
jgi:release factor glutamine methyltransferase